MIRIKRIGLPLAALAVCGIGAAAQAQAQDQEERLREALQAPERSDEAKQRDETDMPIEVMEFLGVEDGMTALDVISASGYWAEVLSAAVGPSGKVYMHNPAFMVNRGGDEFMQREQAMVDRLGNVEPVHGDLAEAEIAGQVDVAITSMNFHDQYNRGGLEAGAAFLQGIYDALKPGGVLGLIDHVGIEGQDNAEFHRVQPEAAKEALEEVGFTVEAESDLLENPDDPHTVGVRDPSVRGHTDKFLFLARKPE
ncbi:MAG TPA: hypothetical protein VF329_13595 [Gammaproteobacteria bacterium]